MSKFIIRFPTLLDMMDFIAVTGNVGQEVVQEQCSVCGFFSDAEIELARNGMHGDIKPFDKARSEA